MLFIMKKTGFLIKLIPYLIVTIIISGCGSPKNQPEPTATVDKTNNAAITNKFIQSLTNRAKRTNVSVKITPIKKSTNVVVSVDKTQQAKSNITAPQITVTPAAPAIDYAGEKIEELKIRASNGDPAAQVELASRLMTGKGVNKDEAEAIQWLSAAAQSGYAIAQNRLGIMYANGQYVQKDPTQAVYWYKLAAEQDYISAQNNLGIMYANGIGVEKDDVEAYKWLTLAGAKITNAMVLRDSIAKRMTPEQLKKANEKVAEYFMSRSNMMLIHPNQ